MKVGDKVTIGNGAVAAGLKGVIVEVQNMGVVIMYTYVPKDNKYTVNCKAGGKSYFLNKFIVKDESPKPGDRVRITLYGWEGCEGTVTYSKDHLGRHKVLITKDPQAYYSWIENEIGNVVGFYPDCLKVIEPVADRSGLDNYQIVLDHIAPFV